MKGLSFVFGFVLLLLASSALAQVNTVSVDLQKARIAWDWEQGAGGRVNQFIIKFGPASGLYDSAVSVGPAERSFPIAGFIKTHGTYFVVIVPSNEFGDADPSNEISFATGVRPVPATNARVVAQ